MVRLPLRHSRVLMSSARCPPLKGSTPCLHVCHSRATGLLAPAAGARGVCTPCAPRRAPADSAAEMSHNVSPKKRAPVANPQWCGSPVPCGGGLARRQYHNCQGCNGLLPPVSPGRDALGQFFPCFSGGFNRYRSRRGALSCMVTPWGGGLLADTVAPLVLPPAPGSRLARRRSKPFQRVQSVVTLAALGAAARGAVAGRLAARRRCGMAKVTAQLKERFLAAVGHSGNVTHAAMTVGLSRRHVYRVRAADPAFAAAWHDAVESYADLLEGAFGHSDASLSRCWYRINTLSRVPLYLAHRSANI